MTLQLFPFPLPVSADRSRLGDFGREVRGVNPASAGPQEFAEIEKALYEYGALLFRGLDLSPEDQLKITKAFDSRATKYGHGTKTMESHTGSILAPYLRTLPRVPQVQLIGHGTVRNHEGIPEVVLKHGHHSTFHKTRVSAEDEAKGVTRFFRWHMDAALYEHAPPRVTTLYGIRVPRGPHQTVRYDDGSGDELEVPLGTTAFMSARNAFDILPAELKSLAVRAKAKYAPRPFEWMQPAHALPTALGLETEGLERPLDELSAWEEEKVKIYPFTWKNPVTGNLHLMIHGCAIQEMIVEPLPPSKRDSPNALYPSGAHLTDLKEIRDVCYRMQRPAISPSLVYPHDWREKDLMIFHNRGLVHSVVGVFEEGQVRVFHQCNLAASDDPEGPDGEDVAQWA